MKKLLAILISFTAFSQAAYSDDKLANNELMTAVQQFAQRKPFAKDEPVIESAIQSLEKALSAKPSSQLRYQILVFYSQVLVWKGKGHTSKSAPIDVFELAMKKADEARNLDNGAFEGISEAHYLYSISLGLWAMEKGPLNVLARVGEMKDALDATLNGETLSGDLGETLDSFGADRIYGRLYFELPALAGGDNKKSQKHLEKSFKNAPEHSLTVVYLADTLAANNELKRACQMINDLLTKDPMTLIPDRAADTVEEFELAKKFKTEKCLK